MTREHVPSHQELIGQYQEERNFYESKFKQSVGIIIVLVVTFLIIKVISVSNGEGEA